MDKYEEYKDSGVKWLGQIPKEWEVSRVKNCFCFGKGLAITKADLTDNGIKVISYGQIHSKENSGVGLNELLYRFVPKTYLVNNASAITKMDDFLFADTSEDYAGIGDCSLVDNDETIFAGYHTIIARPYNVSCPKYQAYLFTTDAWRNQLRTNSFGVKVFSITQKTLKDVLILLPSLDEQKKIVDYLDYSCMIIDADIVRRKSIIAKCQEYRQSVITEAVTKGLDKSAPMQDSGVEWIGKIPKKWKVTRLKNCLQKPLQYGANSRGVEYSEVLPRYVRITDIISSTELKTTDKLSLTEEEAIPYLLNRGDILFARSGATIGKAYMYTGSPRKAAFAGYLIRATTNDVLLAEYLMYYTESFCFENWKNQIFIQATIQNIGANKYNDLRMPLPDIKEQYATIKYLDKQCAKIDAIINNNTKLVEKLEELKKSLIYEVVTGKRKVC